MALPSVAPESVRFTGVPAQIPDVGLAATEPPLGMPEQSAQLFNLILSRPISVVPLSPLPLNLTTVVGDKLLKYISAVVQVVANATPSNLVKVVPALVDISIINESEPNVFI